MPPWCPSWRRTSWRRTCNPWCWSTLSTGTPARSWCVGAGGEGTLGEGDGASWCGAGSREGKGPLERGGGSLAGGSLLEGAGSLGEGTECLGDGEGRCRGQAGVGQGPGRGRVWGVCVGSALTCWVQALLRGLNLGSQKHAVPSLAVALALEGKASHRELTSRLLSDLVGRVVSPEDIAWAFDKMLQDLPDLILDTPEAPQMLGQFIARAVADHALPLDFLERYKGRVDCEHARAALDRAAVLLRIKRDVNRLDNVWGVGGGQRPVKHLVKEMNLLLREYLLSGEVSEAERCLRALEVPHFHHELVYEAVVMVLEGSGDAPVTMMVTLLKVLWETGLVTLDQMNRGFQRVYAELGDISLDVPLAHGLLERLVELCFQRGIITRALRDACPARGRKRFVSEGDGGQVKQ
uniref:Programmed cell death protein 4 n=1 Tax=Anas platyrhynchos platyrhynchos TaxID=8840 RepID=A0A493TDG3_ANAPP